MMRCERCDKGLSRKTARQIDGKVICSACLFPKLDKGRPAKAIEAGTVTTTKIGVVHESAVANGDLPKGA